MPWGAAIAAVGAVAGSVISSKSASKSAKKASETKAASEREGLEYQMGVNELPLSLRNQALEEVGGFYGLDGGDPNKIISDVKSSPFYEEMLDAGSQGVARSLSATGGLRTGTGVEAFRESDQNVLGSLVNQRLSGLTNLSQTPINAAGVGQSYSNIGSALAGGQVASANARQVGYGQALDAALQGFNAYQNTPSTPSNQTTPYTADINQYNQWVQGV